MLGAVPGCGLIKMIDIVSYPVVGIKYVGIMPEEFF